MRSINRLIVGTYTGDPKLDAIISRELRYGQTRWTEIWCSIIMVFLGVILLEPYETFGASPGFSVIRQYITEGHAAILCLVTGTVRLMALYVNGSYKRTPLIRVVGCVGGFFFFSGLAYGIWLASPYSTGVAVYGVLAIAELHSSSRAARDAFAYDSLGTRQRERDRNGGT